MTVNFSLSAFYVGAYNKDKKNLLFFITGAVSKKIMLNIYNIMVKDQEITPIEKIPEENKKLLVEECNATGMKFTNETLINSARILHAIKFINENS